jgi:hypothetical protein
MWKELINLATISYEARSFTLCYLGLVVELYV